MHEPVAEYFARHIALVLNNDESSAVVVNAIARDVIREDGITAPEWSAMDADSRNAAYASQIGAAILAWVDEVISETIDSEATGLGALLIREVMFNPGSPLDCLLGARFMPEDSDILDLLPDGDEDEDETHPCGCPADTVMMPMPGFRAQCGNCAQVFTAAT